MYGRQQTFSVTRHCKTLCMRIQWNWKSSGFSQNYVQTSGSHISLFENSYTNMKNIDCMFHHHRLSCQKFTLQLTLTPWSAIVRNQLYHPSNKSPPAAHGKYSSRGRLLHVLPRHRYSRCLCLLLQPLGHRGLTHQWDLFSAELIQRHWVSKPRVEEEKQSSCTRMSTNTNAYTLLHITFTSNMHSNKPPGGISDRREPLNTETEMQDNTWYSF